ncbi:fasciclin domain-containing protein [Ferruginibacter sp. SUN002]|uniref:fasciclin domain-containing protein n=1 Tax=Ferruginibacter sp. SUN002 TaxID=2937789 RepID=UPI003D3676D4
MKSLKMNFKILLVPIVAVSAILTSCNKDLESFAELTTPPVVPPTGITMAAYLDGDANYSLFDTALKATGLHAAIFSQPGAYTVYAPSNTAIKTVLGALFSIPGGSPDAVYEGALKNPAFKSTLTSIVLYHIMVTKQPVANFSTVFPNKSYSSALPLDPVVPFRMNLFPSARTGVNYVNNIPITAPDLFSGSNGVIHGIPAMLLPASGTLKTTIAGESSLSYFRAAVARADSGSVGLSKFDSLLNYAPTNMTVLAPNDNAFKALIYNLVYGKVFLATGDATIANAQANGAVAAGPAFLGTNNVTTELVKGIVAYHLLASLTTDTKTPYQPNIRAFSVNFSATPSFIKTLVNNGVPVHPGVMVQPTFTGPVVSSLKFSGLGTFPPGGTAFSDPPASALISPTTGSLDRTGVNGVYYVIDKVLLPQ